MLKNVIRVSETLNVDATMVYFDVVRHDTRCHEIHWTIPGATPEDVQTGILGKAFRSGYIASIWCRREAECYVSENGGKIHGYAPSFDIWDAKYDA